MSYILQALRRSGRALSAPGAPPPVAAAGLAEEPRHVLLRAGIAAAVLVLAGAAGYYVYSARAPVTVAAPAAPTPTKRRVESVAQEAPASAAEAPAPEPATSGPPAAPEAPPVLKPSPFAEPPKRGGVRDLAEQLDAPPPRRAAKPAPAPPAATLQTARLPVPAAPPVARADDGVKFLRAMPPEFRRELPELVVNIHIYSPNEAERILYINNRQYQAGDKVREDIRVEAIVEDGAVLSFRGQRFKLPRPS